MITPAQVDPHRRAIDPHLTVYLSQVVLVPSEGGEVQPALSLQSGERAAQTEVQCPFTVYRTHSRRHHLYMGQ
jgi:hypothetical protein